MKELNDHTFLLCLGMRKDIAIPMNHLCSGLLRDLAAMQAGENVANCDGAAEPELVK